MVRVTSVAVVLCLAAGLPCASQAQEAEYHRYYFKQPLPLEIAEDIVAVYDESRGPIGHLEQVLALAAVPDPEIEVHPIAGWYLVRARPAVPGTAPGPVDMISRLIGNDASGRFFFSPRFTDNGPLIPTPRVLVQFREDVSEADIAQLLLGAGARGVQREPLGSVENTFKVLTNSRSGLEILEIANRLAVLDEVVYAEPSFIMTGRGAADPGSLRAPSSPGSMRGASSPNDPLFNRSWGLNNTGFQFPGAVFDVDIEAPEAWNTVTGDPSIVSVVLDTGVDQGHPDINQLPGRDFTHDSGDGGPSNECDNHGTWVAGVIGSKLNNQLGTVGVAPDSRVMSARIFVSDLPQENGLCPGTWSTEFVWTVEAIAWASSIGARITINSNVYAVPVSSIEAEYNNLSLTTTHFAAAGNQDLGTNAVTFPATVHNVVAVSAIDFAGELWAGSSWGPKVEVAGPGFEILTTDRAGAAGSNSSDYTFGTGTSFATPMAAGVAVLALSINPGMTPFQVRNVLAVSTKDLGLPGKDDFFGYGLINAQIAIIEAGFLRRIFSDGFESGGLSNWSDIEE